MNSLVIGGAGFIGSQVTRCLVEVRGVRSSYWTATPRRPTSSRMR